MRLANNASGQLIRKQNRASALDATTYGWDSRGRLVSLSAPGLEASFKYDPLGRRSERRVNGQSTRYVYDGIQAMGEISEGQQSATLLTGLGIDEMLARYTAQGARSALTDALGSVIALTREDQSVLTGYAYSPYGQSRGSGTEEGNASQYTGRENDGTGLYYYRARYYDPVLKRFVSEDPIGLAGGINAFAYVGGDPLSFTDPTGEVLVLAVPVIEFVVAAAARAVATWAVRGAVAAATAAVGVTPGDTTKPEQCTDNSCPPCTPYAKGTIGYIGPHTDHDHFPIGRPHLNLFQVNQNPKDCKCRWNKATPDVEAPPPQPGWVNLNGGFPPLSP